VRPAACAGHRWVGLGEPRYTAWRSKRTHTDGCVPSWYTGHAAGTLIEYPRYRTSLVAPGAGPVAGRAAATGTEAHAETATAAATQAATAVARNATTAAGRMLMRENLAIIEPPLAPTRPEASPAHAPKRVATDPSDRRLHAIREDQIVRQSPARGERLHAARQRAPGRRHATISPSPTFSSTLSTRSSA
jgi:hypothetical protein